MARVDTNARLVWRTAIACAVVTIAVLAFAWAASARAQDAPAAPMTHWYDAVCCDRRDCGPVVSTVRPLYDPATGHWIVPAGTSVLIEHGPNAGRILTAERTRDMGDLQVDESVRVPETRYSQDNRVHACIGPGGWPLCLYIVGGY